MLKRMIVAVLLLALLAPVSPLANGRRGPRPEVTVDFDMANVPQPAEYKDALYWDFFNSTFGHHPRSVVRSIDGEAAWNVNAWDEVPDSSWYTNRNHLRVMTTEQVAQGPAMGAAAPDVNGKFAVMEGKTAGTSAGFGRTRDSRGNVYFIKFDSAEHPEMTTGAEVVGSRLFHAMGWNVPAEWVVGIRADQFTVAEKATVWDEKGSKRAMTQADIDVVLKNAYRMTDGRYRAVLSLLLPGKPVGFFQFTGTRKDDANDLIPHEHRRELRGMRLMGAWINHYDIRVGNTLDMYVEQDGRKFVRHYLIDFGSTLGSASFFPKLSRMGHSYMLDFEQMLPPLISLGASQPHWRERDIESRHPSIGPFASERFQPEDWRPVFPVPAFVFMDDADAFWGAKVVMSFTEPQIRAVVEQAQYSSREAADYLVKTLIERQRKIGQYAFNRVNPLDRFRVSGSGTNQVLEFEDLAVRYGLADGAKTVYGFTVAPYDRRGQSSELRSVRGTRIPLADLQQVQAGEGGLYEMTIGTARDERNVRGKRVTVYLQRDGDGFRVRGWQH